MNKELSLNVKMDEDIWAETIDLCYEFGIKVTNNMPISQVFDEIAYKLNPATIERYLATDSGQEREGVLGLMNKCFQNRLDKSK